MLELEDIATKQRCAAQVTEVSNQLHARNGHYSFPVGFAMAAEIALCLLGLYLLGFGHVVPKLLGLALLILTLQPTLKFVVGLAVGIRYAYAYLWYFEPRFKMAYGTYLLCSHKKRVLFQFAGSLGTPTAFLVGAAVLNASSLLQSLCLLGFIVTASMQVGAFVAAWFGVRKFGPFLLSQLTTPAALAVELRALR